jgi:UDP-glucuronate decarboxylase
MHPNDGRVVSNFIVQALQGKDITLYGNGLQTRSFCYVDDLIEAFIRFMDIDAAADGNPPYPGPINIGNSGEFTIKELAEIVIDLTGSKSKITYHPLPKDDPMQRQPNITLARKYLNNWQPRIQLKNGLEKTIMYFDTLLTISK